MDLFDWLEVIRQLREKGKTQQEIAEVLGWSRGRVSQFIMVLENVATEVLEFCKLHQEGRVASNATNVAFNFTEGWFRDSGIYDLPPHRQIREQLIKDNLLRRHLTPAQKAEVVLKLAEVEAERARQRQLRELKPFKNENVLKNDTVEGHGPPTDKEQGRAIEIAVKKAREAGLQISDKTVKKAKKILEVAEKDPEIKQLWEQAKKGDKSSIAASFWSISKLREVRKILLRCLGKTQKQ